MKNKAKYILFSFVLSSFNLFAQSWTQKASLPAGSRSLCVSFSIGNKGYLGTGVVGRPTHLDEQVIYQDFWEWDPATNVWTQKADFTGGVRYSAVGFSIGAKGYIGTGHGQPSGINNDFWEWDQATNTWTQKANFGGAARELASGFSIGTKGYIGVGVTAIDSSLQDFWEWDQASDTWTQKADFGGGARCQAVAFSIGAKGYIGTGIVIGGNNFNDFWEWDQAADTWIQKADFGGTARRLAAGFSIGAKGYIGTGTDGVPKNDFWEWDQATDTWKKKANFGGTARQEATGFAVGNKGYISTGADLQGAWFNDFWEYCETCSVTGIHETNSSSGISVYPNPSNGFVFLDSDNSSTAGIKVFNSSGEIVFQSNKNISSIDLSDQPKGVYIILLTDQGKTFSKTIIIQ
jgi:N-acetylneuraminic acid mutarotase